MEVARPYSLLGSLLLLIDGSMDGSSSFRCRRCLLLIMLLFAVAVQCCAVLCLECRRFAASQSPPPPPYYTILHRRSIGRRLLLFSCWPVARMFQLKRTRTQNAETDQKARRCSLLSSSHFFCILLCCSFLRATTTTTITVRQISLNGAAAYDDN